MHKQFVATTALALGLAFAAAHPATAAITSVIDFDNVPEGTIAANFFTGAVFTGASVLTVNSQLNSIFPPFSEPNVIFDYLNGTITIDLTATNVTEVGAFVTTNTPITMTGYSGATIVDTEVLADDNFVGAGTGVLPNYFLNVTGTGITQVVFSNNTGSGNTFTLDNLTIVADTFVSANVPEPASMALLGIALAGLATSARRRA